MISVGGKPTKSISLTITWSGCWTAFASFDGASVSGTVVIDWRGWLLTGKVDEMRSGVFAGEPSARIVGGLGWLTTLEPKSYHDDRGLTARELATVIAGSVGETIQVDAAADRNIGNYFAVRRESAGEVLTRFFGRAWYVDTGSMAHAGVRPGASVGRSVAVLNYDHANRSAQIYAERPDEVPLGALLPKDSRLTLDRRVTALHVIAKGDKERIVAYTEAA